VPKNTDDPEFPVTAPGGREVDCPVVHPDGSVDAVEVKTYNEWRTVKLADGSSASQSVEVPLSPHIKEQINKDAWLMRNHPGFRPRWEFLGAGPSQGRPGSTGRPSPLINARKQRLENIQPLRVGHAQVRAIQSDEPNPQSSQSCIPACWVQVHRPPPQWLGRR
jgi:hypothetical protein